MSKQVWPTIIFKLGPLTIVKNWLGAAGMLRLKYYTILDRETYYSTLAIGRKLLPGVYWLKEFRAEVQKTESKEEFLARMKKEVEG